jgi:hypothetical protein
MLLIGGADDLNANARGIVERRIPPAEPGLNLAQAIMNLAWG